MKVTFLGTGTSHGVPVIGCNCEVCHSLDYRDKRLRTSLHINIEGKSFIFDTGPDFRQQILENRITTLDALFFTHEHKDHIAGMDDVRGFNYKQEGPIPVYARKRVINRIKKEFEYVFEENPYPGVPQINLHYIGDDAFKVQGVELVPIEVLHHKLPVLGFRIGKFAYITDASYIAEKELEKLKGVEILVINALQKEHHIAHFSLDEAISMINYLQPQQAYLIHISHNLGLHEELSRELPRNIYPAHDGLTLEI